MALGADLDLDELLSQVQALVKKDSPDDIESKSTLTEQDIETLRKLRALKINGPRQFELNERRVRLIDCVLEHGATSRLYRAMRKVEFSPRCSRKMLPDLWSYLPRHIVINWILNAKICRENKVTGNLVCFAYEQGDHEMLLRMFDYGVSCYTKNDEGKDLLELGNECSISVTLGMIRYCFAQTEAGHDELYLPVQFIDSFLATIHVRNLDGDTILQVALKNGHRNTAAHIVNTILQQMPKNFVLDVSSTMSYDELLEGIKTCLNDVKTKLDRLNDQDDEVFEQTSAVLDDAAKFLKVWRKYESGMDHFFGEPYLMIISETLEVMEDKIARFYKIWQKQGGQRNAKSFVVDLVQMTIVAPVDAFLKTTYGAKLHQAAVLEDIATAAECIKQGARLDLIDRHSNLNLLHHAVENDNAGIAILLLDNKVDPRLEYYNQQSLLQLAVEKGNIDVVEAMLKNFDDVDARIHYIDKPSGGLTALQLAAKFGQFEICKCLLKYQANYCIGKSEYYDLDNSAVALTESEDVKFLFELIDWLFLRATNGDTECLVGLSELAPGELLAVCNARNSEGYSLEEIARFNQHLDIASGIGDLLRQAQDDESVE